MLDYRKYSLVTSTVKAPFSEINIVPFTDIILVLLIIFMVAAPGLLQSSFGIQLPEAQNTRSTLPVQLTIVLNRKGNIFLISDKDSNIPLSHQDLQLKLKEFTGSKPELTIILQADKEASHGQVVRVLDLLRSANIHKIYVGTQK